MKNNITLTIALDLEGTLISNAVSQFPRPGLYNFLDGCKKIGRVVIFTTVDDETFRKIANILVKDNYAPAWFKDVLWVDWFKYGSDFKDLSFIPDSSVENAVLVDDHEPVVNPEQKHRWIEIPFFDPENSSDDELIFALKKIHEIARQGASA